MGVLKSLSKYGLLPAVALGNLATKGLSLITGKKYGTTTLEEASSTTFGKVLGLSTLGTAAALTVAAAGVPAVTKAITPTSIYAKAGGILVGGAAISSPKVATAVLEAPFTLFEAGKKIGTAVEELPQDVSEAAADKGKLGLIGAGIVALSSGLLGGAVIEAKDLFTGNQTAATSTGTPSLIDNAGVVTPQTQVLGSTTTRKSRKSKPKIPNQIISQRVSVNVGNKRYLNKTIQLIR